MEAAQNEALQRHIERRQSDAEFNYSSARVAIDRQRLELDNLEKQLRLAHAGQPYKRIYKIDHLDANPVFGAFAAIEDVAQLQKLLEQS